jgi:hypothetical protein
MPNWKTSIFALISAVAGFVLFSPQYFPPWAIDAAKYIMVGGLAAFGFSAKDYNVSGGQRGLTGKTGPLGPAGVDAPQVETTVEKTKSTTVLSPP